MTKPTKNSDRGKSRKPAGKTANAQERVLINKFVRMLPGQSFFVADATQQDLAFLRRPAAKEGVGISIHEVEVDEIYQQKGVRVWRMAGAYDDL